jgi:hypothetical protein
MMILMQRSELLLVMAVVYVIIITITITFQPPIAMCKSPWSAPANVQRC